MRPERLYLDEMVEAADRIAGFIRDVSETDFYGSELLLSGVAHQFMIIGEAAAHISLETRSRHPHIPWTRIVGFRNVIVHMYFSTDETLLWNAAIHNAPLLKEQIEDVVKAEYPVEE